MVLSAFLCPGLGQLVQRRWIAGGLIVVLFLTCLGFFLVEVFAILKVYYSFATDFAGATAPDSVNLRELLMWLGAAVVVYLISLIDVYRAFRRDLSRGA